MRKKRRPYTKYEERLDAAVLEFIEEIEDYEVPQIPETGDTIYHPDSAMMILKRRWEDWRRRKGFTQ